MIKLGKKLNGTEEIELNKYQLARNILFLGEDTVFKKKLMKNIYEQLNVPVLTIDTERMEGRFFDISIFDPKEEDYKIYFHKLSWAMKIAYGLTNTFVSLNSSILEKLYEEKQLTLERYIEKLNELSNERIDLLINGLCQLEDKKINKEIKLEELLSTKVAIHINMNNKATKAFYFAMLLYRLLPYLEDYYGKEWEIENVIVMKNISKIMVKDLYTIVERFFHKVFCSRSLSLIISDEYIEHYENINRYFMTKLILNYQGDMSNLNRIICFDQYLPSNANNIVFMKTLGYKEEYFLVEEQSSQKLLTYQEYFEEILKENGYDYIKQKNNYLIMGNDIPINIIFGKQSLHLSGALFYALDKEEAKILELISSRFNKEYGYLKFLVVEHELKFVYDDIIFNRNSILNFVYKLEKISKIIHKVYYVLKEWGIV